MEPAYCRQNRTTALLPLCGCRWRWLLDSASCPCLTMRSAFRQNFSTSQPKPLQIKATASAHSRSLQNFVEN
eukprot:748690-Rhodomonas_salina.1